MVPTFTEEPRCVNCHGGVDPFADPTNHGGGTQDPKSDCDTCHSEMPGKKGGGTSKRRLALPEHSFLGKDAVTLCKQMRSGFVEGADFLGPLINHMLLRTTNVSPLAGVTSEQCTASPP